MNISTLDECEREDQIFNLFEAVKENPLVDDEQSAELFSDYIGLVLVYRELGYKLILDRLATDTDHLSFLNSYTDEEETITVLMAINNYIL